MRPTNTNMDPLTSAFQNATLRSDMSSRLPKIKFQSKKEFLTFAVSVVFTLTLPPAVYVVQTKITQLRSQAVAPDLPPIKVAISNIYGRGFSVSWITNGETTGKIYYGTVASGNFENVAGTAEENSSVHHVGVNGLEPETDYHFKICSGDDCSEDKLYGLVPGESLEDNNLMKDGVVIFFTTPKELSLEGRTPFPAFGVVLKTPKDTIPDGDLPQGPPLSEEEKEEWINNINNLEIHPGDFLVRLQTKEGDESSNLLSYLSNNGETNLPSWVVDLTNARSEDLSKFFDLEAGATLEIEALASSGRTGNLRGVVADEAEVQPVREILWLDGDNIATLSFSIQLEGYWPEKAVGAALKIEKNEQNMLNKTISVGNDGIGSTNLELPTGTYKVLVKGPYHLQNVTTLVIESGKSEYSLDFGTQLAGDLNDNNIVDILDLAMIASNYGTDASITDINSDGQTDVNDLALIAKNYNTVGETK